LNEHCRFYDKRIGQSVTLSGRQIVRHMMSQINQTVTGEYTHEGEAIVYGDTDSCYFSAFPSLKKQIENG
jgi:DNA polymerase elongation subunit (family B)